MKKNQFLAIVFTLTLCITISSCIKDVKDAVDETAQALECANRVREFDERNEANPDRSCADIVADLNDLERTCAEYISESTKDQFATLRTQCEGN